MNNEKIKIIKNGPYLVTGKIPLIEMVIKNIGGKYVYEESKRYEVSESYALCRCGKSKRMPFCDGSHIDDFNCGTNFDIHDKTAIKIYEGKNLILEDNEKLCAVARFCHYKDTDAWNLLMEAKTSEEEEFVIDLVGNCPSGRLTVKDKKTGVEIEPAFEKSIAILHDPEKDCSGPLWIRGGIEIEGCGKYLEKRNRVTLCRCGHSKNKPFCDGTHINILFKENKE